MNTDKYDELDSLFAGLKRTKQRDTGLQNAALARRIMQNLPEQGNVIALPARRKTIISTLSGALAASLIALAIFLPTHDTGTPRTDQLFEQWAWEEVLDETPSSENEPADFGILALLDLNNADETF